MHIQGQAAVVTGGASGLGEATARALAALGAQVAILDRNEAGARRVADALGGVACACDITDPASVEAALAQARLAQTATGSAGRIARLCLLAEPPALDRGEVTDKGSINQRAVLLHRADTVQALHADALPPIFKPQ